MKIIVNEDLMLIEIYDGEALISQLNFDICDNTDLKSNVEEIEDLINYMRGMNNA